MNSVGIDWLRFSLPNTAFLDFLEFFQLNFLDLQFSEIEGRSFKKYVSYFADGAAVHTDSIPNKRGEIHGKSGRYIIDLSGSGLGNIAISSGHSPLDIVRYFNGIVDFRCNRIDVAYDDFWNFITPEKIAFKFKLGDCTTRWLKGSYITSFNKGKGTGNGYGDDLGETCYLGTRASSSFMRVYDKLAQLKSTGKEYPSDCHHWVRCELEIKKDRATALCKELSILDDGLMLTAYLCSYLRGQIDFKCEDGPSRVKRRETVSWWFSFLQECGKYQMRIPKPARSIDQVDAWLTRSAAPSLALILEKKGSAHLVEMVRQGSDRLTPKHLSMLHGS